MLPIFLSIFKKAFARQRRLSKLQKNRSDKREKEILSSFSSTEVCTFTSLVEKPSELRTPSTTSNKKLWLRTVITACNLNEYDNFIKCLIHDALQLEARGYRMNCSCVSDSRRFHDVSPKRHNAFVHSPKKVFKTKKQSISTIWNGRKEKMQCLAL